jgi:hypothetical protein
MAERKKDEGGAVPHRAGGHAVLVGRARPLIGLLCAGLLFTGAARAETPGAERMDALRAQFRPTGPTLVLTYDLVYRLLGLTLARIASARVETTEGVWSNRVTGLEVPVYLVEGRLDTFEGEGERSGARVSMHDRLLLALTADAEETLVHARLADQRIAPFLGRARENRHAEVYDLQSGQLEFFHEDYVTGRTVTRPRGGPGSEQQGGEVAYLLRAAKEVYRGTRPNLRFADPFRLYVEVNRQVTPFAVRTVFDSYAGPCPGRVPRALRLDVVRAPEAPPGRHGKLTVTCPPKPNPA